MPKQESKKLSEAERRVEREHNVAKGGSTRAAKPRSGRSGSDSNASKTTRGR